MLWLIYSVLFAFRNADVVLGAVGWGQNQPDSVGGAIVAGPFSEPVNDLLFCEEIFHSSNKFLTRHSSAF